MVASEIGKNLWKLCQLVIRLNSILLVIHFSKPFIIIIKNHFIYFIPRGFTKFLKILHKKITFDVALCKLFQKNASFLQELFCFRFVLWCFLKQRVFHFSTSTSTCSFTFIRFSSLRFSVALRLAEGYVVAEKLLVGNWQMFKWLWEKSISGWNRKQLPSWHLCSQCQQ